MLPLLSMSASAPLQSQPASNCMAFCHAIVPSLAYLTTTMRSSVSVATEPTLTVILSVPYSPPRTPPLKVPRSSSTDRLPTVSTMLMNVGTPSVKLTPKLTPDIPAPVPIVQLALLTGSEYNVTAASVGPS